MNARKNFSDASVVELIPALRAFARSLCRRGDIDDLVQETLTKAIGASHQFQPGTKLKSWLFTIMRNTFYTAKSKEWREGPAPADCVSTLAHPYPETQEWSVVQREVEKALDLLPHHQRQAIVLCGVLEMEYAEAARICNCSIGTIKSRVNRARARLVESLGGNAPANSSEARDGTRQDNTPRQTPTPARVIRRSPDSPTAALDN